MRTFVVTATLGLVLVVGMLTSLHAAGCSGGIIVDTAFRAGILFGHQRVRQTNPPEAVTDGFRTEVSPRLPVISGMFELSPLSMLSARAAGATSVFETDMSLRQTRGDSLGGSMWNVNPNFRSYEGAVLVHICAAGAYRFSAVGGYRQEDWNYPGSATGIQPAGSELRDQYRSEIPFFGLQTTMFFPWWKARVEVLGSPWVSKRLFTSIKDGNNIDYTGYLNEGGLIEVQVDGSAQLTSLLRCGLYGRYSYQDLNGLVSGPSLDGTFRQKYKMYMGESFAILGLNFNVAF
ncbi:MAG: hypothetical protein AB1646_09850 [Thermodesulfobacteriota bacterium]